MTVDNLLVKYPLRLSLNPFIADIGSLLPELISGSPNWSGRSDFCSTMAATSGDPGVLRITRPYPVGSGGSAVRMVMAAAC